MKTFFLREEIVMCSLFNYLIFICLNDLEFEWL